MKYLVQSNHAGRPWEPPPEHGWETIGSDPAGHRQEHDSLDVAIRSLKFNANLARCVWPIRVIDSEGKVYGFYSPAADTRLPGCRWEIIQKNAYYLWEAAGRPESNGEEFWFKAENELVEHDGVSIRD